jgi:predicted esterase
MIARLHAGQPIRAAGESLETAAAALVLVHGRGATAADILYSAGPLIQPGWAFLAPEAANHTWYPLPFTVPPDENEPWLSSAFEAFDRVIANVSEHLSLPRVILLGFSQGACLALEYAARHPRRYGAVIGLSGGLIGPEGMPRAYTGSLAGTPVLLVCSDSDPYIAASWVRESGEIFRRLQGDVAVHIVQGMGHEVTADEIRLVGRLMEGSTT